jgi:hypothetical protein
MLHLQSFNARFICIVAEITFFKFELLSCKTISSSVVWRSYVRASQVYLWRTTYKMQRFPPLFIFINCPACFRRFLRPSSGAQNCTYSVRYCQNNTAACCCRRWDGTEYCKNKQIEKTLHPFGCILEILLCGVPYLFYFNCLLYIFRQGNRPLSQMFLWSY